jgi:hypothetical protein
MTATRQEGRGLVLSECVAYPSRKLAVAPYLEQQISLLDKPYPSSAVDDSSYLRHSGKRINESAVASRLLDHMQTAEAIRLWQKPDLKHTLIGLEPGGAHLTVKKVLLF